MTLALGRRAFIVCAIGAAMWPTIGQAQLLDDVFTRAERTNYAETSRYEDVMEFVRTVADASPLIHFTTFGYTFEGRAMPLLVVGDVASALPDDVRSSGKTRVYVQGNIHAGEVCGKEAMQMMLRDLAQGKHADWLDSLVLLIVPIYNSDGNERVRLTNRGRQNGPVAGMGQRSNAQGYDLNRDHMKLDSPEARSLVRLMTEYDPHVAIDLHTTNGTRHAYHITYSPPLHPDTDERIDALLRGEWLPAAARYLEDTEGWEAFYYGNGGRPQDGVRQWRTFDYRPRFNNNYIGLRNRFAILSEAYSYATFEERVIATLRFTEGAIQFAAENAARIRQILAEVDATPIAGSSHALRAEPTGTGTVEILMGEVDEVRNPYSGRSMLERRDVSIPEIMEDYGTFIPTETERVPSIYYVPAELTAVIDKLRDHGVVISELYRDATGLTVEEFRITGNRASEREFQQHNERTLEGSYHRTTAMLPAGTYLVSTEQPLGRLVFHLLEPRAADGLVNWNVLDQALEGAEVYPILRSVDTPPR